jgi:predicted RNase H-like nuclease (RuvC/YqgF family)
MAEQWLTYAALADLLGVSAEAVRQKAIRHRWRRQTANDGRAQVLVDVDEVRALLPSRKRPSDARPTPAQDEAPDARPTAVQHPSDARMLAALEAHVETLKAANAKLETEVKRERARADGLNQDLDVAWRELALAKAEAATVPALKDTAEALKAALASSKDQTTEIRAERDRLLTREHLREQRRWWRRLTG